MKKIMRNLFKSKRHKSRRIKQHIQPGEDCIYFLHIGKNAGTQIGNISRQINELSTNLKILKKSHDTFLKTLPEHEEYFFSIRNPISRFRSGFYSRKRKGQPRIYSEWSSYDEIAFSEFDHANHLAETLFEPGKDGHKAWAAMKSLRHTAQNQSDWFYCCGNFLRARPPVWIIRQEHLDSDLRKFISIAFPNLDISQIDFSSDDLTSHRNDYTGIPPLSPKAKENLERWYAQDFSFYEMCNAWIEDGGRF